MTELFGESNQWSGANNLYGRAGANSTQVDDWYFAKPGQPGYWQQQNKWFQDLQGFVRAFREGKPIKEMQEKEWNELFKKSHQAKKTDTPYNALGKNLLYYFGLTPDKRGESKPNNIFNTPSANRSTDVGSIAAALGISGSDATRLARKHGYSLAAVAKGLAKEKGKNTIRGTIAQTRIDEAKAKIKRLKKGGITASERKEIDRLNKVIAQKRTVTGWKKKKGSTGNR